MTHTNEIYTQRRLDELCKANIHNLALLSKAKKTLQEIKTIVKNICDGCTSECDCDEDCNYFLITEALDKGDEE